MKRSKSSEFAAIGILGVVFFGLLSNAHSAILLQFTFANGTFNPTTTSTGVAGASIPSGAVG